MRFNYIRFFFTKKISLFVFFFFFTSCVYFNTFYNVKDSFNNAIEIIENDSSKNFSKNTKDRKNSLELSSAAKKMLRESIASSNIVLQKYPNSKYVDDAVYYIGRSYFYLGEIYKAEKFFTKLINEYSYSEYYDESHLWLAYSYLKLNLIDSAFLKINKIEIDFLESDKNLSDEILFLFHDLKGETFIQLKEYDEAFIEFEKSLKFIKSKTKKTMMYSKLSIIFDSIGEFERSIDYLNKIQILSNDKDVKIESFRRRIDIMKKLNLYDEIISEIQKIFSSSLELNEQQVGEFNIELAIAYFRLNNFYDSKKIFNNIIDEDSRLKDIIAESYYWLGYISLFYEFEIDLALEYFNLVNETKRSSKYSKETKEYIKDIESYKAILEEYDFLLSDENNQIIIEDKEEEYFVPNNNISNDMVTKDSLLFIIAEKLFFDFKQTDLSIVKHNELIQMYSDSKYSIRSQKIIDQLLNGFVSNYQSIDSLSLLRDYAWDRFDLNLKDEAIDIFENIAIKYNDFYSYYSLGLIYEDYLNNPYLATKSYLQSFQFCSDDNFKKVLKNKMLLLEGDVNNHIILLNKKLNYLKATNFITNNFNIDSALFYLDANYDDEFLKNKVEIESKGLYDFIINNNINDYKVYTSNDSLIIKNIILIDSLESDNSNIYSYFNYYSNEDSVLYIDELIEKNTLLNLFQDSILYRNLTDTLEIKDDNYKTKAPNINNSIVPEFNKK